MGFDHRKLRLTMEQSSSKSQRSACVCISGKNEKCSPLCPPPMPSGGVDSKQKHFVTASMTVMASIMVVGLLFGVFCAAMRVYYLRRNNSRRRASPPIIFGTQEDFLDENYGPAVDHHIWYINTVGLPQSVIDSITAFKYRKDDCLIEGTECSVCLSEFQEDDNLRLLPKCSHAFHIPCIDTWLRSHKNCPMCRAPVICATIAAQASEPELNLNNGLNSGNENTVENPSREETINMGEVESSEVGNGHDSGVLSDIANDRRVVDEEMQPMRRSVSLDSSSAAIIHKAVAARSLKSKNSKSKMDEKASSVNSSIGKLTKSSSSGSSLQKGSISMKRSFSRSSSRHGRRYSSLPL